MCALVPQRKGLRAKAKNQACCQLCFCFFFLLKDKNGQAEARKHEEPLPSFFFQKERKITFTLHFQTLREAQVELVDPTSYLMTQANAQHAVTIVFLYFYFFSYTLNYEQKKTNKQKQQKRQTTFKKNKDRDDIGIALFSFCSLFVWNSFRPYFHHMQLQVWHSDGGRSVFRT